MPRSRQWLSRINNFHLRDVWWRFLDFWDKRRWLRRTIYISITVGVICAGLWSWYYPQWLRKNSLKIARDWMAAGKLKNAADMVQKANELMPERPEPWQLASELARLGGQYTLAARYARRAVKLAPESSDAAMEWAAAALRAGLNEEAAEAFQYIPPEILMNSPFALRVHGELSRRNLKLETARGFFEAAIHIEGPLPINQVPLGLILIRFSDTKTRQYGLRMLAKWTSDSEWGPAALRALLQDALINNDESGMLKWGEILRAHPGFTVRDMPDYLQALAMADETKFQVVLKELEQDHAVTPEAAAVLLGWLNRIGRHADAVSWIQTLPTPAMQKPPLAMLAAEALRATASWPQLAAQTEEQEWGPEFNYIRWAFAMQAAKGMGQNDLVNELRKTLYNHTRLYGVHALFIASTLYSWNQYDDALNIWWQTSELGGDLAVQSLGALARHYQVWRDADGQYRVFRDLYFIKPHDVNISNNFAFFALLTNRDLRLVDTITEENMIREPENENFAATRAFALLQANQTRTALALLQPLVNRDEPTPGVIFAYGLALAKEGQKEKARELLLGLPPESLTIQEVDLIKSKLRK